MGVQGDEREELLYMSAALTAQLFFSLNYSDEYCPHCDNHFVLDAQVPKPVLQVEGEDVRVDAR